MSATFLVAGKDAGPAVGLSCRTGDVGSDPQLTFALGGIASRIAALMNVATLSPVTTTDYFNVPDAPCPPRTLDRRLAYGLGQNPFVTKKLRLSNGLVDPTSVVITDGAGASFIPFSDASFVDYQFLDPRLGLLDINSPWTAGQWAVTYNSGLPVFVDPENPTPDPADPIILDTSSEPWMRPALATILRIFNVTTGGQMIQEGLRFDAVDTALRLELSAWVYQSYERPRYGVIFPSFSKRIAP